MCETRISNLGFVVAALSPQFPFCVIHRLGFTRFDLCDQCRVALGRVFLSFAMKSRETADDIDGGLDLFFRDLGLQFYINLLL